MNSSILLTIKKMLGIADDYTVFDQDIIVFINSTISVLRQIGVGPSTGYRITGPNETWSSLVGDATNLEEVKTYIYLRVKRLFDPPASSSVLESFNSEVKELEWRLNVTVDTGEETD